MNLNKLLDLIKKGEGQRIEFKREVKKDIGKEICAFANSLGGYIIVGVNDDGKIVGCNLKTSKKIVSDAISSIIPKPQVVFEEAKINNKGLLIIEVKKSNKICSIGGQAFIRIGNIKRPLEHIEILSLGVETGSVYFDSFITHVEYKKNDLIREFLEKIRIKVKDELSYLRGKKIILKKGNKYYFTNLGLLFFTYHPEEHILGSSIRVIYMKDNVPIKSYEFKGPLWKIVDEVYNHLLNNIDFIEVIVGIERKKIRKYPERALREAIINAVIHKNYAIPSEVKIFLYPDKIIIKNPGGLMPGVDLEDPEHIPRNPYICELMHDLGYIEKYGYGIKMIREACKNHPLIEVKFKPKAYVFEVIFEEKSSFSELDPINNEIYRLIKLKPRSSSELARLLKMSKTGILKRIKRLISLGLIKKIGSGVSTRYSLR